MFADRRSAGAQLAANVSDEHGQVAVLGIARGGVIVAEPIATALRAPLDVIVIRKLGHPLQPELAIGAVSSAGECVLTEYASSFTADEIRQRANELVERAKELEDRLRATPALPDRSYAPVPIEGVTVILVDDGIATSATILCAISSVRHRGAARVVCAAPVVPAEIVESLRPRCDRLVTLLAANDAQFAVGRFYVNFSEVSDEEVRAALDRAR